MGKTPEQWMGDIAKRFIETGPFHCASPNNSRLSDKYER
jgi:hypothetical protein